MGWQAGSHIEGLHGAERRIAVSEFAASRLVGQTVTPARLCCLTDTVSDRTFAV